MSFNGLNSQNPIKVYVRFHNIMLTTFLKEDSLRSSVVGFLGMGGEHLYICHWRVDILIGFFYYKI